MDNTKKAKSLDCKFNVLKDHLNYAIDKID